MDLLRLGLKISHLRLAAAMAQNGKISDAADTLGISQPAASRLASELEQLTGSVIYERSGRGIELTEAGKALAYRSARVLQEIGDAGRDIEQIRQGLSGSVSIGSVTGPSIDAVLPALRQVRLSYPKISLEVEVSASDVLMPMLMDGRLDFAICRPLLASHFSGRFTEKLLGTEPVSFIVRKGHPLAGRQAPIALKDMLAHDWVLPTTGTILHTTVVRALREAGVTMPNQVLTTSSFLFTVAMVRQTNAIAPLASAVAKTMAADDQAREGIVALETDFSVAVEPYSLLTRADQALTPAADTVYREVEKALQALHPSMSA